ncbi:MAG: pyridoxal-phosphate dependent enzyme [Chloroflexi bacterium]|nr:MAG: pyridoxal-phosphate dependent enzyme [Chloroflexota bacterium]
MGVIARYREHLPVGPSTPEVDLKEASTPLVPSLNIGKALGLEHLYFKYEGLNPTGSFKDRGMVVAVAKALEAGHRVFMCASTGNTSASMAAYAARTGATVRDLTSRYPVALMNSVNPHRIEGQKTAAFEIVDELGDAPDYLILPVGNAGNITAYWRGFRQYHAAGRATRLPRMVGAQAEGAAPIVNGSPVADPKTVASAIKIGNPASWEGATSARDESGGAISAVSDIEILSAQIRLAGSEGLFAEPASAAPLALLFRLVRDGKIDKDAVTVVVLTGSGLKDPEASLKSVEPPIELDGDARTLAKVLKL